MHLAIGVRDILGRENITEIHRALADVHEVCLRSLVSQAYRNVAALHTPPRNSDGRLVEYAIMLIGKLASREPNYHSDVSMLILYDSSVASHGVFFQQVAQKLISMANRVTRFGRMFELKAWQPMGLQGSPMAWNPELLLQAIEQSDLPIEQRMNLYTARVIGESAYADRSESTLERFLQGQEWSKQHAFALVEYRRGLELSASPENIKRGWGGTLDVEVLVHSFYAKHLHKPKYPWLRGTVERLEALRKSGVISPQVALVLRDAYHFLRSVESGLRLMNTKLRHDLPKDPLELSKLAYVLQLPDREQLLESCEHYRRTVQDVAQRHYAQWRSEVIASAPLGS
jgi:glutamate-ammonia-ligase adenylyltransferase